MKNMMDESYLYHCNKGISNVSAMFTKAVKPKGPTHKKHKLNLRGNNEYFGTWSAV